MAKVKSKIATMKAAVLANEISSVKGCSWCVVFVNENE